MQAIFGCGIVLVNMEKSLSITGELHEQQPISLVDADRGKNGEPYSQIAPDT